MIGPIDNMQSFEVVEEFDNSTICSALGLNNLARVGAALKNREYTESLTELMKAAMKWTLLGAACLGAQKLYLSRTPIYLNPLHERAVSELSRGESGTVPSNCTLLIDQYYSTQSSIKRWRASGKNFVATLFKSNAPVTARHFLMEATNKSDSRAIREVISLCANAWMNKESCLRAQVLLSNELVNNSYLKKMESACTKSRNTFCQNTRNDVVERALSESNWKKVAEMCIPSTSKHCEKGLTSLENVFAHPTNETFKIARTIDFKCRKNALPICQKSLKFQIDSAIKYGSWETITSTMRRLCSKQSTQECRDFVEDAANALAEELKSETETVTNSWELSWELRHPSLTYKSKVPLALTVAKGSFKYPSASSSQNMRELANFIERTKNTLPKNSWSSSYSDDQLRGLLEGEVNELNQKVGEIPKITSTRTSPLRKRINRANP